MWREHNGGGSQIFSTHCNMLPHTTTLCILSSNLHCNTLQHTATHCKMQGVGRRCFQHAKFESVSALLALKTHFQNLPLPRRFSTLSTKAYLYTHMYTYVHVFSCFYIYVHICMYVSVFICMYIYAFTYIHAHVQISRFLAGIPHWAYTHIYTHICFRIILHMSFCIMCLYLYQFLNICIQIRTHTPHKHTNAHTRIHTHTFARTLAHTHTQRRKQRLLECGGSNMKSLQKTKLCDKMCATHLHANAHTHTHTRTHTQIHVHAHTHKLNQCVRQMIWSQHHYSNILNRNLSVLSQIVWNSALILDMVLILYLGMYRVTTLTKRTSKDVLCRHSSYNLN